MKEMASQNKITEIIAAIKTIYPYYAKDADVSVLVKLWISLLREFPDEVVEVAFYKCLQTCKMPPTPADVLENIKALHEATEPTDEELWNALTLALREAERQIYRFPYTFVEANGMTQGENARRKVQALWEGLPEKVRQYIGGKGEFIRMAQTYDSDELKFEKTRFLKTMPIIKNRNEYSELHLLLQGGGGVIFGRLEGGKE